MSAPAHLMEATIVAPGVVAVRILGLANTTAGCSCGWTGRRRFLKAAAEQDAWAHAARGGCDVATPMVLTW